MVLSMNYAILRTAKIKKGNVGGMCHHHARTKDTPNADIELKHENELLAGQRSELVPEIVRQRISAIEEKNGRKTRKDAVACVEVLMTASPEFFKDKEQVQAWAKQSVNWVKEHFNEDNVVNAVLHLDESTPHIHAVVVPETQDHKLSAKHWLGGREKMQNMQDSYAEKMQVMDLERGIRGSRAKHMDIKKWYSEGLPKAQEQVKNLLQEAQELKANVEKSLKKQFSAMSGFFQARELEKQKGHDTKDLSIEKAQELIKKEEIRKEKINAEYERTLENLRKRDEKTNEHEKSRGLSR